MYITPNDPDFNGVAEGCVEEALFLIKEETGKRAICDVHLCDCDEDSPSGCGWDYTVYKWDGNEWISWDGGLYWDYASADAMLDFESEFPADFGATEIRLVNPRDDASLKIDELLDYDRLFTEEEWEEATPV